jgi:tetratricopeptide (TPR) repeat protein
LQRLRPCKEDDGMSMRSWTCEQCQGPCKYEGLQLVAGQQRGPAYGVRWACPACDFRALDVCPLGPLVPSDAICVNCGEAYPVATAEPACAGCGLTRPAAFAFLRLDVWPADPAAEARDLFGRGMYRRGLAILNHTLELDPAQAAPWVLKCSFLEDLGLHAHQLAMLGGALAAGGPASLLIAYASSLYRAGRYEASIAASRRYLELEQDGPWVGAAHSNLGLALRALGRQDEAEELYRQAIRVDVDQVLHYRNLAQLLVDQQRWSGALGVLEAGLQRATTADDKVRLLEGLAFVCAEEERAGQALAYVDQAFALGGGSGRTHYLRGRALALLGRLPEARSEVRRVLELEPNNAEARQAMSMIDKALTEA